MFDMLLRRLRTVPTSLLRGAIAAVLVALVFITTTRLTPLQGEDIGAVASDGGGSMMRQLLYLACFATILVCLKPWDDPLRALRLPLGLALLMGYCVASLYWSVAPGTTVRRLVLTLMVVWIVVRGVDELGYRRATETVLYACLALLLLNYLAVAVTPAGIHHEGDLLGDPNLNGSWRGILPHKNGTGPLCAYTLMLLAFGIGRIPLVGRLALVAATAFFLVKTQSKTSIALVVIAIASGYAFTRYNPRYRVLLGCALVVIASAGVYAGWKYLPPYLRALAASQDAFTGRIQIWRVMIAFLRDYPALGAGFGAFWNVPGGPVSHYSDKAWIIDLVAEGHNGYLDVWTQIGFLGLVLTVLVLLLVPLARLVMSGSIPRVAGGLQLAVLVFALGHNATESSLLATDQFMHVVILLAIACIRDMGGRRYAAIGLLPPGGRQAASGRWRVIEHWLLTGERIDASRGGARREHRGGMR